MGRDSSGQEVSCTVALPISLYPSLQHRRPVAGASPATTSTANAAATAAGGVGGAAAKAREAHVPGVILEVRQLWQSPSSMDREVPAAAGTSSRLHSELSSSGTSGGCLYAFVRVKDADHRLSGWFPLHQVFVKQESALSAFGDSATRSPAAAAIAATDDTVPLSSLICGPWLTSVYEEVTPGMARTQRARRQLDYLEERLLRDCRTPTTVRYFVYLNRYIFSPWYYAPFGLLNSEYNPLLCSHSQSGASPSAVTSHGVGGNDTAGVGEPQSPQPFIRDAFLCPFSLRIFSTYAQMHYETRTYRADRLRPPGEEIYRDERRGLSLFKINGSQHVTYCRHLFLIGKSFLENKLAGHDVHSYYFYVVCLHHCYFPHYVNDTSALYFAGFFTWEKHVEEYNLACIVTLPCFGRRHATPRRPPAQPAPPSHDSSCGGTDGTPPPPSPPVLRNVGQFMIAVSYELAYRRRQIGTPEKPLSDLGTVAYQHYWRRVLVRWMKTTVQQMRRAAAVTVSSTEAMKPPTAFAGEPVDVVVVAAAGGAGGTRKRARPTAADVEDVNKEGSSEDEGGAAPEGAGSTFTTRMTIKDIAAAVRLEEADVLTTLLGLGVLHRSSEDRSTQLLLPQRYVDWMYDEILRWEASTENAVFQPELLKARGSAG